MSTEATSSHAPAESSPTAPRHSAVEEVKEKSGQLRGTIALELVAPTDHFAEHNKQLLKFHGSYQQEDRDARKARRKEGVGKHYMFMVRCKIPAGKLTAAQYLALDDIAGKHGNGTLRLTTRQGIQLHGVLKSDLHETIAGINACLLTTLGACGDVERNVTACPAPHHHDGVHAQLQETAAVIAAQLAPRSRAYHEIWLNGKPVGSEQGIAGTGQRTVDSEEGALPIAHCSLPPVEEPLYGKLYLPRKFKTGLALPEDNCIDVYAQDLGLLAIVEGGAIAGYNVLVGGGMGMSHGNASTFPYLAQPICYVPARAVVGAAEAVVKLFRDHGNRANRKRARIKYLVHDWGKEKFRDVLAEYVGGPLHEPRPVRVHGVDQHLGWRPQGDGKWYFGLSIENGRVKDEGTLRLRTCLRQLAERYQPDMRITAMQDLLLCNLDEALRPTIERLLAEHGVRHPDQVSTVRRLSMACPAVPTCGLALTESERVLPGIIDQLEAELARLGLKDEQLSVRMTGCPNGCARPYQSDIGLVGRSGDKFTVFVGGRVLGDRLSFALQDLVPQAHIVPLLIPLLAGYKEDRKAGESFGDYCHRLGAEKLQHMVPEALRKPTPRHPADAAAVRPPSEDTNGDGAHAAASTNGQARDGGPAPRPPETQVSPLTSPAPTAVRAPAVCREEVLLAGTAGEELRDCTFSYNSDGSVRETVVYFYGDDRRADAAHRGDPLRRGATYFGRVDVQRLYAARKLSDTHHVGSAGHERRDRRVEYHADGTVARTVLFYYDGDLRAAEAPSGAAVRRQVAFDGAV
jgi:sulfite reductase (ferredoxin)